MASRNQLLFPILLRRRMKPKLPLKATNLLSRDMHLPAWVITHPSLQLRNLCRKMAAMDTRHLLTSPTATSPPHTSMSPRARTLTMHQSRRRRASWMTTKMIFQCRRPQTKARQTRIAKMKRCSERQPRKMPSEPLPRRARRRAGALVDGLEVVARRTHWRRLHLQARHRLANPSKPSLVKPAVSFTILSSSDGSTRSPALRILPQRQRHHLPPKPDPAPSLAHLHLPWVLLHHH